MCGEVFEVNQKYAPQLGGRLWSERGDIITGQLVHYDCKCFRGLAFTPNKWKELNGKQTNRWRYVMLHVF